MLFQNYLASEFGIISSFNPCCLETAGVLGCEVALIGFFACQFYTQKSSKWAPLLSSRNGDGWQVTCIGLGLGL